MATQPLNTRLDEAALGRLDELAARLRRSRESIVAEAVNAFVDDELALLRSLDEAAAQLERGEFLTQEQVEAWFEQRFGRPPRD